MMERADTRVLSKSMISKTTTQIIDRFSGLKADPSWSFSDQKDRKKSIYITHAYHRYPAKFTPQIVEKLIGEYAADNSVVCDPFGGCGTTLVESKVLGVKSVGFDINPVAKLITQAKLEAIEPTKLSRQSERLFKEIESTKVARVNLHKRLDFWFSPKTGLCLRP